MSEPGRNYLRFADGAFLSLEPSTGRYTLSKKDGTLIGSFDGSGNLRLAGAVVSANGVAVVAQGFPLIVAAPAPSLAQTGALTNFINFTPPATTGQLYRLTHLVNITAWTTPATFNAVVGYTDDQANARSEILGFHKQGATPAYNDTGMTVINRYYGTPILLSIDGSGTAITVSTSGTFTGSPVYSFAAVLERLI